MTRTNSKGIPFRYDQVGSLLRPETLKEARAKYSKGEIEKSELTEIENIEISRIIAKQKEVGLKAVTDGEFRRRWWHLDFIAELNGISIFDFETTAFGIKTAAQGSFVSSKLSFNPQHSFIEHFKFTRQHARETVAKQTIPGPNMILLDSLILSKKYHEHPVYENINEFIDDLITTYKEVIRQFYEAGCRYLQLDDTSWGALFDDKFREIIRQNSFNPDELITTFGDITEAILEDKPKDLAVTFHFCKGNFQSHWLYNGSYDKIAERLFSIEAFDGFFLEFDDERSGSFEPLKFIKNQRIVLGLVTSKTPELENKDLIIKRIKEASRYVPLEQICLSPQCGFASTHEGNKLTEKDQWEKLKLVVEISKEVWPKD